MSAGAWIMLIVGVVVLYGGLGVTFIKIFRSRERKEIKG
ncbi:MAG: MetS family NSS transporter small subunit [Thermodesulfobacteriota bacterium]|nr:MetS family NSS transporter small subunit [Thermodesulfobacteriota bacterium]